MFDSFPVRRARMEYVCTGCNHHFGIDKLHYTCPDCGGVFLLQDLDFDSMLDTPGVTWQATFDRRRATKQTALRGIFRFYELMAPVLEAQDIVFLGEGDTPVIEASTGLKARLGLSFAFKNDGQNPSASFKDRGMACVFSYLKSQARQHNWQEVLTICASTGDTSAAAALYGAYVGDPFKTVVLLPQGKVTPQQLSQPLGSGALVLELPGVFDDCMKVVEHLAEEYQVALLNSKNSWRILGQESYAFEAAQWYDWDMDGKSLFVPIGNAGNISSVMSGLLKLYRLGIIKSLPRVFGVQSDHASPVWKYYNTPGNHQFEPVRVEPSVAQAAMIGNPVSFPRVKTLVEKYQTAGGEFHAVRVSEQAIMDAMLVANKHGHIACTQGGECLAGLLEARQLGLIGPGDFSILDATAHSIKFSGFQDMYFQNSFPPAYEVRPRDSLVNLPESILSDKEKSSMASPDFTRTVVQIIADRAGLRKK